VRRCVTPDGAWLHTSSLLVLEARRSLVWMARRGNLTLNRLHSLLDALHEDLAAFAIKDLTVDLCADAAMPAVTSATQRRSSVCRRCEGGARGFVCNRVHQHTKTQGRRQRAIRRTGLAWRPWSLRLAWIHP
jgi:hypothetical protein